MLHSFFKPFCALLLGVTVSTGASVAGQAIKPVSLTDMRGMRYCEILLVFEDRVAVYNTTNSAAGCPADLWEKMDRAAIAAEHNAKAAQLNGPKFWATDAQTLGFGQTETFGGIAAGFAATLPISALGGGEGADPYQPFTTKKDQTLIYKAGQQVFELIDPDGKFYVLNAYGGAVKDGDPENLMQQLEPAEGWSFQVRTLDEDLVVVHSSARSKKMVGDDLHQYYSIETDD